MAEQRNKNLFRQYRDRVSEILVKWSMPTRQLAIIEIVNVFMQVPCCGHRCCCNEYPREEVDTNMAKGANKPKKQAKKAKKATKKK